MPDIQASLYLAKAKQSLKPTVPVDNHGRSFITAKGNEITLQSQANYSRVIMPIDKLLNTFLNGLIGTRSAPSSALNFEQPFWVFLAVASSIKSLLFFLAD